MKWIDRIKRARKVGRFTEEDRDLASSYLTCAVGERAKALRCSPYTATYEVDNAAINLVNHVCDNNMKEVLKDYNIIQGWRKRKKSIAK